MSIIFHRGLPYDYRYEMNLESHDGTYDSPFSWYDKCDEINKNKIHVKNSGAQKHWWFKLYLERNKKYVFNIVEHDINWCLWIFNNDYRELDRRLNRVLNFKPKETNWYYFAIGGYYTLYNNPFYNFGLVGVCDLYINYLPVDVGAKVTKSGFDRHGNQIKYKKLSDIGD